MQQQQGELVFKQARSKLPLQQWNNVFKTVEKTLNSDDQMLINEQVGKLSNDERLHQFGVMSARELLARIGVMFLDNQEAFEQLLEQRRRR